MGNLVQTLEHDFLNPANRLAGKADRHIRGANTLMAEDAEIAKLHAEGQTAQGVIRLAVDGVAMSSSSSSSSSSAYSKETGDVS